jgi:hypothetical protein
MSLEKRTQALLELIADDRRRGCGTAVDAGHREAGEIAGNAWAQARRRLRETLAAERSRLRERLGAAEAHLENERRQHDQRRSAALLAAAWNALPAALEARWADGEARRRWVSHIAEAALRQLPGGDWSVAHAPGLESAEREALAARLAGAGDDPPTIAPDEALRAGLKLRSGANLVDGSLEGLLDERTAIEARLLDRLEGAT